MMNNIKFVVLEDIEERFNDYSNQIKEIFSDLSINCIQILDNHSDVKMLMRLYWDYISDKDKDINKKQKIEQYINSKRLKLNSVIYFIDDNWENSSNDNHDGTNFYKDILLQHNNSSNVIVLTNYTVSNLYKEMQYTWKNCTDIKADLKNKITNTNAYKLYKKNENKQAISENPQNNNTQSIEEIIVSKKEDFSTKGIPTEQAKLISNEKE